MARGGPTTNPRERAGDHQGTGPTSPSYTPERNQILGIFAVSKLDEVTEGYVLGSGPYVTEGRSTFAPPTYSDSRTYWHRRTNIARSI